MNDDEEYFSGGDEDVGDEDENDEFYEDGDDDNDDGDEEAYNFDDKDDLGDSKVVSEKVKEYKVISSEELVKTQQKHLKKVHNLLGISHSLARMLLTHYQW